MAEAVVGIVVEQLVSAAASWLQEELSLVKGVKPKLDNMKNKLQIIQLVLEDAENQSVKKKSIKLWLEKLQNVSYDMDDVLDGWRTRIFILKREEAIENGTLDEIVGSSSLSLPTTCFSFKKLNFFSVKELPWRCDIARRIKEINDRIDSLFSTMKHFKLALKAMGNDGLNKIINNIPQTTNLSVDESKVNGRGDDKNFLLHKVLSMNTEQEKNPQVISIIGTGGLGKTNLAHMVYNDQEVMKTFGEKRIWVCVSNPFDEVKVAKNILDGLKVHHTKMITLEALHQAIEKSLSGHKFFLVLDDAWDEEVGKWERLKICLKPGDPYSRILVTTRKEEVATVAGTTSSNILKPQHISDSDCWFLMKNIAFQGRTNKDNEKLEEIGKQIAKKCKGLPLAAKMLGGMLISKYSSHEWKDVLYSEIWESHQTKVEHFPHIFLSYQKFPIVLKRSFLILAIFPKDAELEVERVIAIWMAHGFLNQSTKDDDMTEIGKFYIKILLSRGFLKEKYTMISMHDIMHDFAVYLAGDELISIIVETDSSSKSTAKGDSCLKSKTRHLNIVGNVDSISIGSNLKKLRTCLIQKVATNVTSDLVKGIKMVRALYLVHCDLKQLPESIGNLIHLRLLDLSHNPLLVEFPETIGELYNLQQLFLDGSGLSSYPISMRKLAPDGLALDKAPESVGKLINLHNLGRVCVKAEKGKLRLLKDLNQLRGVLLFHFMCDYRDEVDAKYAEIGRKKHITEVKLHFCYREVPNGVIAALQPHSNIRKLTMWHLPRSWVLLPSWITSLHHLTELDVGSGNVLTLPHFWKLPCLQSLTVSGFRCLKLIDRDFLGMDDPNNDEKFVSFPNLEKLKIFDCRLLEWEDLKAEDEGRLTVIMPKLQDVEITCCYNLQVLPSRLLCQAANLERLKCGCNGDSLPENIKKDTQLLTHVQSVFVDDQQCSLQSVGPKYK